MLVSKRKFALIQFRAPYLLSLRVCERWKRNICPKSSEWTGNGQKAARGAFQIYRNRGCWWAHLTNSAGAGCRVRVCFVSQGSFACHPTR